MPSRRDVREERERRDRQEVPGHRRHPSRRAFLASLAFLAAVLAGCGSSPAVRYYTLSSNGTPAGADATPVASIPSIGLGPITLPDVVDRPQFVLRAGANQVVIAEEHRWAEPLKSEIPRVIAENLSQMLGMRQVWSYPQSAAETADVRVLVDVQRFDSAPGEAATIGASWTVQRKSGEPASGRSLAKEAVNGSGYDAVAAAHSRALASVSRDIAAAIRLLDSAGAKPPTPASSAPPAPPASAPSP